MIFSQTCVQSGMNDCLPYGRSVKHRRNSLSPTYSSGHFPHNVPVHVDHPEITEKSHPGPPGPFINTSFMLP